LVLAALVLSARCLRVQCVVLWILLCGTVWLGDQLLEHALVYGEYKGIPRQQVDAALGNGSDVVLRIDVQVRMDG
jgi:hypothetical protein